MVPGEGKTVRREVASILKAVMPNLVSLAFTTDLWTSLRFLHQPDAHIHHKDWLLHNWVPFVRLPLYIILVCFSNNLILNMNTRHFPEQHFGSSITLRLDNMIERLNLDSLPLSMYESFSDVGEIRVYFASKILTPCRMH